MGTTCAIEQIAEKSAFADEMAQVAIGGGDHAHVNPLRPFGTERPASDRAGFGPR
jgi:hypothetical protein